MHQRESGNQNSERSLDDKSFQESVRIVALPDAEIGCISILQVVDIRVFWAVALLLV